MIRYVIAVAILLLLNSCSGNSNQESESEEKLTKDREITDVSLTLTDAEHKKADIQTSGLEKRQFAEQLSCTGTIEVSPNHVVTVIPPVKGYIKELYHQSGDYVTKGDKLATLSHPRYLTIQQNYLSAKTRADYYEKEYKRQGELAVEKAASLKKMQHAKADYEEARARLQSLSQLLNMMNIDPATIKEEELHSNMLLYAPINGYITEVYSNAGRLADEGNPVYEIMNMNHLRLHMHVPGNKAGKISEGQSVRFTLTDSSNKNFNSTIDYISKKVNADKNRISVYAQLKHSSKKFKHGMNVNAHILIATKTKYALPKKAIVKLGEKRYIFLELNSGYKLYELTTGSETENYTAIKNYNSILTKKIVTEGTDYLKDKLTVQ